jgi:hypothetical protein
VSLKQKIREMTITCFAANGDQIEMLDPKDVEKAIGEASKQIQKLQVAVTLEHTHPHPEFWRGWNRALERVLSVLGGDATK